jgi:3alpha(or 20beta)-hydroxysteroid dehydrogenase
MRGRSYATDTLSLMKPIVMVTGSSRGIGLEIALQFSEQGATVAINGRSLESAEAGAQKVGAGGGEVRAFAGDVSKRETAFSTVEDVLAAFGHIDILINNAGSYAASPLLEYTEESWDSMMRANVHSALYCMQAVIPSMKARKSGSIVNLASVAGRLGTPNMAAYGASKAALISLTKSAALEFAGNGLRINAVAPGLVDTAMGDQIPAELGAILGLDTETVKERMVATMPLGRFHSAAEVASAVVYVANSHGMIGNIFDINGGRMML